MKPGIPVAPVYQNPSLTPHFNEVRGISPQPDNPKFLKIFVALLIGFATFTRSPMDCNWQPGEAQINAGDSTNKVSCDNEEKTQ